MTTVTFAQACFFAWIGASLTVAVGRVLLRAWRRRDA